MRHLAAASTSKVVWLPAQQVDLLVLTLASENTRRKI
jgi:hypothetical protein